MEKNVWILNKNKTELIQMQRVINNKGSLRAFCALSGETLNQFVLREKKDANSFNRPSLIVLDYETEVLEEFASFYFLQKNDRYAGVPLAFTVDENDEETDFICYDLGAMLVLKKPLSSSAVDRIERMSWQYEKTKNYERMLIKQSIEIKMAREIKLLNEQLEYRNDLLHKIFGRFFSSEVVDVILNEPGGASIGGEKREIVVMMADVRGFTTLSEQMDADTITDMINRFLEVMTDVIFKYHGAVIEYIGDAILAVFGAPVRTDSASPDAVAAAIEMQNSINIVNDYNKRKGYKEIGMGIGLHKGEVFIGNIGSDRMMRYNVMGKTVNQCSRIEGSSVGGQILASEYMVKDIIDILDYEEKNSISVKGVDNPIEIYQIKGIGGTYNLHIKENNNQSRVKNTNIAVVIKKMTDKKITEEEIKGTITKIAGNNLTVKLDNAQYVEEYDDILIIKGDKKDSAKVVRKLENVIEVFVNQHMWKGDYDGAD